jgi:predicted PurR-regulated permease PerM
MVSIYAGIIWATASIAGSKGRDPAVWGILAFFFGIIPLVFVAVLPPSD